MKADAPPLAAEAMAATIACHDRTRHRLRRYAPSPGWLDWANEPDPFRRYAGAAPVALERAEPDGGPRYDDLFVPGRIPPRPSDRAALSQLFYDSLAVSAWKEHRGGRWSLRVNPSSGDLHPTEAYLVCGPLPGLSGHPGVFHYCPMVHGLETRAAVSSRTWSALREGLPQDAFLVGLTSIHWREAWKYGERAFRYCELDLGHAVAAVSIAAAVLGWSTTLLEAPGTGELATLLGVRDQQGPEREEPGCLLAILPGPVSDGGLEAFRAWRPPARALDALAEETWTGRPNRLSRSHVTWPTIEAVARATRKDPGPPADEDLASAARPAPATPPARDLPARRLIRARRSALAFDGATAMARPVFYAMLERTLPGAPPFDALPWRPAVHLLLFVHRVRSFPAGLYLLARAADRIDDLRAALSAPLAWRAPPGCPAGLPLFLLREGDFRSVARASSCHQDIASDGAFAIAIFAEFEPRLAARGAWFYRRLHWEAGGVGQVLYLEAEAAGLRATGIGCFFDDLAHDLTGIRDLRYQTLYHFAVGAPVEDQRLTTLPAYPAPR